MKKIVAVFICLIVTVCFEAKGQSYAIVGSGTASNASAAYPAPYGNNNWGARHQFLVLASELTTAGITAGSSISSVGFDVTATNSCSPLTNYQVTVYTTSSSDPIASDWMSSGSVASSTTATLTITTTGYINTSLTTPFVWDGTSNLVIETCFNNGSSYANAATQWTTTLSGATFSRWYYSNASGVCSNTGTTSTSTSTRPNIILGVTWTCGLVLPITHTAGVVAPVTKTVSYGTVQTNLSGSTKCWITQNLGSDHQATSATDATEPSAGWYWQFNKIQGYKHDGINRTPSTTWITSINEISDWVSANDPCTSELGAGWRIPIGTEWTNANTNGAWTGYLNGYSSVLKIHAAGLLQNGSINYRGTNGYYCSSTQHYTGDAVNIVFTNSNSGMVHNSRAYGFPLRCIYDACSLPAMPGTITGTATQTPSTTGQTYSIAPVSGATTYAWSMPPTGWTITSGQGTTSITVTTGTIGQNGNISVTAGSVCGTSTAQYLPVAVVWSCGSALPITHTAGSVAPVSKTVNYGTVTTSLSGTSKCWITQNLGSDHQATSATDATEPSAGWYWQFNRIQGYKHDGSTRTPSTTWITSITENSDWVSANDPCTSELGAGWRIPTGIEWTNANTNGAWAGYVNGYSSMLKIHAAGLLQNGSINYRGTNGYYCSSTQHYTGDAVNIVFTNSNSGMVHNSRAFGFPLRCLKDSCLSPYTPCSITGSSLQCPSSTGQVYSITAVSGATTYTWTVPAGWVITSGQGTTAITVTTGTAGQNGNISVTAGNTCGYSTANYLAVTVTQNPSATISYAGTPFCTSVATPQPITLTGTAGGTYSSTAGLTINSATGAITPNTSTAGTYTVTYTIAASGGCAAVTATTSVTITTSPVITAQPTDQNTCENGSVSFTVGATGGGLLYQWQESQDGGMNWSDLSESGAYSDVTSATMTINPVVFSMSSYLYRVVIAGTCMPSATSTPATFISIDSIPTAPSGITGTAIQLAGLTGQVYSVSAVPNATVYTWTAPTGWNITAGQGTTSITVTTGSVGQNGNITVTAGNTCGTSSASILAVIVSNCEPGSVATSQTICTNSSPAVFTQTTAPIGGIGSYTFQWQTQPNCSGAWSDISGATATTYNAGNLTQDNCYRREVISGTCLAYSDVITVKVNISIGGTASSSQTICDGSEPADITLSGYSGTIQWQYSNDGTSGWTDISSATDDTLTSTEMGTITADRWYRAGVTNSPCGMVNSNPVKITVSPVTVGGTVDGGTTICTGNTSGVLTLAGQTGYVVKWQSSTDGGTSWFDIANTTTTYNSGTLTQNTQFRAVVQSGSCTIALSMPTTVNVTSNNSTILTSPVGTDNQSVCINNAITNISYFTYGATGATFSNLPAGVTGFWSAGLITISGTPAQSGIFNYVVTLTGGCGNVVQNGTITVIPIPAAPSGIAGLSTQCPSLTGQTYTITAVSGATTYNWTMPAGWFINSGQGTTTITVTTGSVGDNGNIRVTAGNTCGISAVSYLAVTVSPVSIVSVSISASANPVCFGDFFYFIATPVNGGPTPVYHWKVNGNIAGTNSATYININLANNDVVTCEMTSNATPCASGSPATSNSITMIVHSLPIVSISGLDSIYCLNHPPVIMIGHPLGGTFSGIGVVGNIFNPSVTGPGIWHIIYTPMDSNGCINSDTATVIVKTVDVSVTQNNNTLTANASGAAYQWVNCDNSFAIIAGETHQSFTASANGNYAIIVIQGSCSDTSSCIQITTVGITSIQKEEIYIYPNPVSDELIIEMKENKSNINFEVYNSLEQLVFKGNFIEKAVVQTTKLTPGVYLIKLVRGNTLEYRKVIKE